MEQPLVSIIVISYNHSKYIEENLNSIKNQTYQNIQLIVGDDASSDESVKVFENWLKDNDFTATSNFHQVNTGLATMLNECVDLVKGKYLKMISADDYLHPESIEIGVQMLENLDDDYAMVFTDFNAIDENNNSVHFYLNYDDKSIFNQDYSLKKETLLKDNCIIAPSTLVKKEAILSTGKYDPTLLLEDHHRWLMISEKMKIGYIDRKLVYYRVLPTSVSITKHEKLVAEDIYLKMKYDKIGVTTKTVNAYLFKKYRNSEPLPSFLKSEYYKYPFRMKRLTFALKIGLNPKIYDKIFKLLKF